MTTATLEKTTRGAERISTGVPITSPDGRIFNINIDFLTATGADGKTVTVDIGLSDEQTQRWVNDGLLPNNVFRPAETGDKYRAGFIEKGHGRDSAGWTLTHHANGSFAYVGFVPLPKRTGDAAEDARRLHEAETQVHAWQNEGRLISADQVYTHIGAGVA